MAARVGSLGWAVGRLARSRVAVISFAFLGTLLVLSAFADLIASDYPIACSVRGSTYVLPCVTHPSQLRGVDFGTADWKIGPIVSYGPDSKHADAVMLAPLTNGHPLGTDLWGRDVFARLVHGARTTTAAALLAAIGFVSLGIVLGALAGTFGGGFDFFVGRMTEALSSFPVLLLVVVVQSVIEEPGMGSLLAAIALLRWPEVARLVRAEVLSAMSSDYVTAARALGASPMRILLRHVLRSAMTPAIIAGVLGVGQIILLESSLDFLGVGLPQGIATWGEMLSEARHRPDAYHLFLCPGLMLFLTVLSSNALGEALRDALDPRHAHVPSSVVTDPRVSLLPPSLPSPK